MSGFNASARDFGIHLLTYVDLMDQPVSGTPVTNPPIPTNPTGVTSTPVRSLHHFATASADGSILIIGDEHRGGGNPGACFVNDPVTGKSTPLGALWFVDISNPEDPQVLSWLSAPLVAPVAPEDMVTRDFNAENVGERMGGVGRAAAAGEPDHVRHRVCGSARRGSGASACPFTSRSSIVRPRKSRNSGPSPANSKASVTSPR